MPGSLHPCPARFCQALVPHLALVKLVTIASMKKLYCSFCRTKQDPLYGLSSYPDSFSICGNCLAQYNQGNAQSLSDTCCFCGALDTTGFEEKEAEAIICVECLARFVKESEAPKQETQGGNEIEEILIDWPVYFDAAMDLINVKVKSQDGTMWNANLTTPPRITWEMEKGKRTGEWASGTYFCHPDLIFVEELTEDLIRQAILDLWKSGKFQLNFRKL